MKKLAILTLLSIVLLLSCTTTIKGDFIATKISMEPLKEGTEILFVYSLNDAPQYIELGIIETRFNGGPLGSDTLSMHIDEAKRIAHINGGDIVILKSQDRMNKTIAFSREHDQMTFTSLECFFIVGKIE